MSAFKATATLALAIVAASSSAPSADVAVAWNDERAQRGIVRGMSSASPWRFVTEPIETGRDVALRFSRGTLYAISRSEGTIAAIDPGSWALTRTYELGRESAIEDIAAASADVAYVARAGATHLARLDLSTGESADAVDLSVFADADGVPDLGKMAIFEGRLFVQVRRLATGFDPVPPALIAVVDAVAGEIIDADPATPGLQGIELSGTYPKMKMQILPASRRLFVSSTGVFHDDGGLEAVDLDALESLGVFLRELGSGTGPEIGAFVIARRSSGYVISSTDLVISSHLKGFSVSGGLDPTADLDTSVDYFVPALVHDPRADALLVPVRGDGERHLAHGVDVFDAGTGRRLTLETAATGGPPTDLELLCDALEACAPPETDRFLRADANADGQLDLSDALHSIAYLFSGAPPPSCRAGADSNDDERLDIGDPIYLINHLFGGGLPPAAPFPDCGEDPAPAGLDCRDYDAC
jgi:hypothetical protein